MKMNFTSFCSFAILVLAFCAITGSAEDIGIFEPYDVYIIDNFGGNAAPLFVHCQSGDNDLGEQTVSHGDNFHWHFRINFLRNTFFFCYLKWEQKDLSFNTFDVDHISERCAVTSTCYWSMSEGGVYFSNDNHNYLKEVNWP
ncbi:self-incompatibility protein S1-like [Cornus florida]|uniref:self-incompatibility protein S1-like n=1 Tax=Cornus florida TaxID=4283 RepID=UPI00289EF755|nr:self-incompatibility protein S1-like [Cornus florida]